MPSQQKNNKRIDTTTRKNTDKVSDDSGFTLEEYFASVKKARNGSTPPKYQLKNHLSWLIEQDVLKWEHGKYQIKI